MHYNCRICNILDVKNGIEIFWEVDQMEGSWRLACADVYCFESTSTLVGKLRLLLVVILFEVVLMV